MKKALRISRNARVVFPANLNPSTRKGVRAEGIKGATGKPPCYDAQTAYSTTSAVMVMVAAAA